MMLARYIPSKLKLMDICITCSTSSDSGCGVGDSGCCSRHCCDCSMCDSSAVFVEEKAHK